MVGRELRDGRISADLSQRQVGRAVGISASSVSRIERGLAPQVSLGLLCAIAAVLGLRLSVRLFPVGQPLRDAGQLALLDRLRQRIHPDLRWLAEMPLPIVGDLRAWDAAIAGDSWTMYVDAETRIRDVQSLARRTSLKHRDTGRGHVLLLVADTRANRAVLDSIRSPLVDEALTGRRIIEALAAGVDPGGNGVLLL
jgi:transcriptional regulator with XRE-family HTH domain